MCSFEQETLVFLQMARWLLWDSKYIQYYLWITWVDHKTMRTHL